MAITSDEPTMDLAYASGRGDPWWFGDALFEFPIPSEATTGRIAVFRAKVPEGFSPPRHIHSVEDETFLVDSGELAYDLAGRRWTGPAGASVFVPAGPRTPSASPVGRPPSSAC